jgi:hypothetical protein
MAMKTIAALTMVFLPGTFTAVSLDMPLNSYSNVLLKCHLDVFQHAFLCARVNSKWWSESRSPSLGIFCRHLSTDLLGGIRVACLDALSGNFLIQTWFFEENKLIALQSLRLTNKADHGNPSVDVTHLDLKSHIINQVEYLDFTKLQKLSI